MSFTVVIDTKEKHPFTLISSDILGYEYRKLKTGDYSIKGMEDIFCIERKANVAELAQNIHQPRFAKSLQRLSTYKYKYIVLEDSMYNVINFPHSSNLPKKIKDKIRISGLYLLKAFTRIQVKYDINIIYCGNREYAELTVINIMKEVYGQNNTE